MKKTLVEICETNIDTPTIFNKFVFAAAVLNSNKKCLKVLKNIFLAAFVFQIY